MTVKFDFNLFPQISPLNKCVSYADSILDLELCFKSDYVKN